MGRPSGEILEEVTRPFFISKLPSSARAIWVVAFDESALSGKLI